MITFLTTILFLSTTRIVYGDDCDDDDIFCQIGEGFEDVADNIGNLPQLILSEILNALADVFEFDLSDIIDEDVISLANSLETCVDSLSPLNALDGLDGIIDEMFDDNIVLDAIDNLNDEMMSTAYKIIAIPLSQNKDVLAVIERGCGSIDVVLNVTDNFFSSLRMQTNGTSISTKRRLMNLEKKCKKDKDDKFCLKWDYKPYINDPYYDNSAYKQQLDAWSHMIPDKEDWVAADTIANYKAIKNAYSISSSFVQAVIDVYSKIPGNGFAVVESTMNVALFFLQLAAKMLQRPADIFGFALEYADMHNGYIAGSRQQKIMHNSDFILQNQLELRDMIKKIDDHHHDSSKSKRRMIESESQSNKIRFEMSIEELVMKIVGLIFVGVALTLLIGLCVWKKKNLPSDDSNVKTSTGLMSDCCFCMN